MAPWSNAILGKLVLLLLLLHTIQGEIEASWAPVLVLDGRVEQLNRGIHHVCTYERAHGFLRGTQEAQNA